MKESQKTRINNLALRILAEELSSAVGRLCPPPYQGERGVWLPGDDRCSSCKKKNCRWQCLVDWAKDDARARLNLECKGKMFRFLKK
jgi:hypothetical protein